MTPFTPTKRRLPLHAIAHGRAGDKGNVSNISVIAYEARVWPVLQTEVTEFRVLERVPGPVTLLPAKAC